LHYAVERKRAERSLRCERDFAEGLIESAQAFIILLDTSGRILRLNAFAAETMKFPPREVLGEDWLSLLVPSSEQPVMREFFEATILARETCLETGLIRTKDGDLLTIHWAARAIRDQEDYISYVLFTGHDVTELEQAQRRALDAERLAAIGQMITGLAHESRNALQRSQACLSMLQRVIRDNPQALDYAARLQSAQDYLRHIFEQVRGYAAPLRLELEDSDVRQLISEAWGQLTDVTSGKRIQLHLNHTDRDLHCHVDRFRIQQAYRNILENAISACDDPVEITVTWSDVDMDRSPALQTRIQDNGPGLSLEQRQQAFEPFYTTKTTGTGLGLAISKRIVESHGGRIEIGEQSKQGADILVTLPRRKIR
jgi:PAS domain S-box-containing protein